MKEQQNRNVAGTGKKRELRKWIKQDVKESVR